MIKKITLLVNQLSVLNSGYDIRNRGFGVKLVFAVGALAAVILAILGGIHLLTK